MKTGGSEIKPPIYQKSQNKNDLTKVLTITMAHSGLVARVNVATYVACSEQMIGCQWG